VTSRETVTLEGDDTLRRTLSAAESDIRELDQLPSARLVAERAAARAPKVSGTLGRSVYAKDMGTGVAAALSDLIYAPVIHNGWAAHHISPQPFLTTALDDSAQLVEAESLRQTQRALGKVRGA
jgi:hypothetical protein